MTKIAVDFNAKTVLERSDYFDNSILAAWIIKSQTNLNVLIIDVSDRNFIENQKGCIYILDQI